MLRNVDLIRKVLTISKNRALHFYEQECMVPYSERNSSVIITHVTGCSEHTKEATADQQTRKYNY